MTDNNNKEKNNSSILSINSNDQESTTTTTKEKDEKIIEVVEIVVDDDKNKNHPYNWPKRKKWFILVVLSCGAIIAPISSTIFYPALLVVQEQLHTTDILANAAAAVFVIFQGIGPLGWAAYSDAKKTRRNVYLLSLMLFVITSALCALSNNIWLLIVIRCLQACSSNALHAIGPSTISDMFIPEERGNAFGFFYLFPLIGPLFGPTFGGYITQYLGWRWIFWLISILGFIILIIIFFFVPETHHEHKSITTTTTTTTATIIATNNTNDDDDDAHTHTSSTHTTTNTSKRKFINPFASLILFRYQNLSIVLSYISIFLSLIYMQAALIPREFDKIYKLTSSEIGLVFLSPAAGYMLGSVMGGKYADYIIRKEKKIMISLIIEEGKNNHNHNNDDDDNIIDLSKIKIDPERRINGTWLGAIVISISYIIYGWLLEFKVSIVYTVIIMFFGGFGQLFAFTPIYTYLVDSFPTKSVWVNANLTFLRQMTAGIMSILAVPMEDTLGTGWTFNLMIFLNIILTLLILVVKFKGKQWRLKFEKDFNL